MVFLFLALLLYFFCFCLHILFHFLTFLLLLLFLGLISSLHLWSFGLPFYDFSCEGVDDCGVINACCDVLFKFFGVALAIEVCVEEDSEISGWFSSYSALSFSKVSLCFISRVRMKSSTMKLEFSLILKEIINQLARYANTILNPQYYSPVMKMWGSWNCLHFDLLAFDLLLLHLFFIVNLFSGVNFRLSYREERWLLAFVA